MNLAIRGFAADLGKEPADTFAKDQHPDTKFDYIIANPPFNISDWGGEKYEDDPRWVYGRPPVGNANYAWLQHMLWKLRPGGKAGVVLANGSLTSTQGGEDQIRKKIIEDDVIDSIILLPEKLFLNTGISVCIWFLNKDKKRRSGEILFINATSLAKQDPNIRTQTILDDSSIEILRQEYKDWSSSENYSPKENFSKNVKIQEVLESDGNSNPKRYIKIKKFQDNDTDALETIKIQFNKYQKIKNINKELELKIEKLIKNLINSDD